MSDINNIIIKQEDSEPGDMSNQSMNVPELANTSTEKNFAEKGAAHDLRRLFHANAADDNVNSESRRRMPELGTSWSPNNPAMVAVMGMLGLIGLFVFKRLTRRRKPET